MKKNKFFHKGIKAPQGDFKNFHIVMMLFLAFFIFTFVGAGSFIIVSLVGLLLCIVGLLQTSVKVDLWVLLPLIFYNIISFLSGYRVFGNTLEGLASTQSVFPIVYLLAAYLDGRERMLLKRLCAIWVGVMAAIGLGQFTLAAFSGTASRLSGFMGNPNAMGMMLVLGWFALQSCLFELEGKNPLLKRLFHGVEFITLAALALTLSIGAFGALGVGVIAMHIHGKERVSALICRGSEIIFAGGCGILLYVAGDYTDWPWLCLIICGYILISAWYGEMFKGYLAKRKWLRGLICLAGVCGAGILVFLRPNAAATFLERLAMIKNGLGYICESPFLGVGPYQWRWLNMLDTDPYFNTWHIHNVFVHVGVELGLPALAMLIVAMVRHLCKKEDKAQRGAFFAVLAHNLMDTSFFYIATVPFMIMISAQDEGKTRLLGGAVVKCIFSVFSVLFAWNTLQCLQ